MFRGNPANVEYLFCFIFMVTCLLSVLSCLFQLRVINRYAKVYTPTHRDLFKDLFRLSVSRYSEVRKSAQMVLSQGFNIYSYSYRSVLNDVLQFLKDDPKIEHHQFKVCIKFSTSLYGLTKLT